MNCNYSVAQLPVTPDQVHRALTTQDYTTIGVLIVGFIIVILAGWKFGSWFGKEILVPTRDKLFNLADKCYDIMSKHLTDVGKTLKDVSDNLQELSGMPKRLDSIEKKVDSLSIHVSDLDENVKGLETHMKLQDSKLDNYHKGQHNA